MNSSLLREGRCPECGDVLDTRGRYDVLLDRVRCPCGVEVDGRVLRDALPEPPSWQERFAEALADASKGSR